MQTFVMPVPQERYTDAGTRGTDPYVSASPCPIRQTNDDLQRLGGGETRGGRGLEMRVILHFSNVMLPCTRGGGVQL